MDQQNNNKTSDAYIDLALEARELSGKAAGEQIPGVHMEQVKDKGIYITRIHVENEEGMRAINKKPGRYITLEVPGLRRKDTELQHRVATRFAKEFEAFLKQLNIQLDAKVLIIGLGNSRVTPDSLGPLVVNNVMITRHYFELMEGEMSSGYRPVSAVAPGVLGTTGIETGEIVRGIVDRSHPDLVIAIDALASQAIERVNTTIQIADNGIHPGSGIGNQRMGLTYETLGVPVIAIGVPTVVYASTIVNNSIQLVMEHVSKQTDHTDLLFGELYNMADQERLALVKEVLNPAGQDLLVTPKEVDQFMEDIANVIASGLNAGLHEDIRPDNVSAYTH